MTLEAKSIHNRKTLLIYTGPGSGGSTARRIAQLCEHVGDVQAMLSDDLSCFLALDSASLQHNDNQNNATQIHAICIPGGSWVQMANFLGELAAFCLRTNSESQLNLTILIFFKTGVQGRRAIKKFVENGGGYLGICAGAQLGAKQSLDLLNGVSFDRKFHDALGSGFGANLHCQIRESLINEPMNQFDNIESSSSSSSSSSASSELVLERKKMISKWHNGPFFPPKFALSKKIDVLATSVEMTERVKVSHNGKQRKNRHFNAIRSRVRQKSCVIRQGNIILCGPHPECTTESEIATKFTVQMLRIVLSD